MFLNSILIYRSLALFRRFILHSDGFLGGLPAHLSLSNWQDLIHRNLAVPHSIAVRTSAIYKSATVSILARFFTCARKDER